MNYDSKEVKEQLPEVKVNLYGKIYIGHIGGRKLPFPRVHIRELCNASWEVSWETITRCIIDNKAIIL